MSRQANSVKMPACITFFQFGAIFYTHEHCHMGLMKSRLPLLLAVLGILQPFCGAIAPLLGIGTPIGDATRGLQAPEQPLPAFFSIWSLIFGAYIAFAYISWRHREPWMLRVGAPLAFAGVANIVWMVSAQLIAFQPLDFLLLFPIAVLSWTSAARFDRMRGMGGSVGKFIADIATGLLSGWILVAISISLPLLIRNLTSYGPTDLPWQMLWIFLATAALGSLAFARYISRSLWFFVALAWGLLGVIANNWTVTGMGWLAIMTGVSGILILGLRLLRGADGTSIPA
ncbi:hypothetical protein [uncultured Hyphomonas sp.]|uniref:hypothetical protein n=1 Tax=uncultured Hyphomonas sp. TaxID=225298 RepID=UPI003747B452